MVASVLFQTCNFGADIHLLGGDNYI